VRRPQLAGFRARHKEACAGPFSVLRQFLRQRFVVIDVLAPPKIIGNDVSY
jgi:hypothetical protein